ncbi:MAG: hypothetical protein IPK12_08530 [Gemmatimonadetes bacterium]|nr:hypothetical protein [Gemmatimonadota bacterium]
MMLRPRWVLLLGLALLGRPQGAAAQDSTRYVFYLHGRIVEEGGRRPVSPAYGTYEYDAILDSLRTAGFTVLSDQRPPGLPLDYFVNEVTGQVDSLLRRGVRAERITVIGFSRGAAIALVASSRLGNPRLNFVFMAGCGPWAFDQPDLHVTGRLLSLYETSDTLGTSCAPVRAPGRGLGLGRARASPWPWPRNVLRGAPGLAHTRHRLGAAPRGRGAGPRGGGPRAPPRGGGGGAPGGGGGRGGQQP